MKKSNLLIALLLLSSIASFAQKWRPQTSTTGNTVGMIHFIDKNNGFAVGYKGTIVKTTNGGVRWDTLPTEFTADITDIKFKSSTTGYISGRNGLLAKTIDGGTTWNSLTENGDFNTYTRILLNGDDIYVSGYGGIVIKSSDGGNSWKELNTGIFTNLYDIFFTDANTGYIVGGTVIIKTIDGGDNWVQQNSSTEHQLLSVWFTNADTGYACGGTPDINTSVIIRTTDGGQNWTPIEIPNNYLGTIRFINENVGYVIGGNILANTGTILKTENAGLTWISQNIESHRLFGSWFIENNGFACGLNGTILNYNMNETTTGIDLKSVANHSISIYPNPFNNTSKLNINLPVKEKVNIRILDVVGKQLSFKINHLNAGKQELTLNELTPLPSGTYFVEVRIGKSAETLKVIKQ